MPPQTFGLAEAQSRLNSAPAPARRTISLDQAMGLVAPRPSPAAPRTPERPIPTPAPPEILQGDAPLPADRDARARAFLGGLSDPMGIPTPAGDPGRDARARTFLDALSDPLGDMRRRVTGAQPEAPAAVPGYVPIPGLVDPSEGVGEVAGKSFVREAARGGTAMLQAPPIARAAASRQLLEAFDAIDRGEDPGVPHQDVILYRRGSPEDRARMRAQLDAGDPRESAFYQAGERAQETVERALPLSREARESLTAKLFGGAGSTAGFVAAGLAGRGLGLGGAATAAGTGAALNATTQFQDALDHGASIEDATRAAGLGSIVGMSEAVPVTRLLDRLDGATGGVVRRAIKEGVKGAVEEGVQETAQHILDGLIAAKLVAYDPEREIVEGVGEAAGIGATVGGVLSFLAAAVGGRRGGSVSEAPPQPDPKKPPFAQPSSEPSGPGSEPSGPEPELELTDVVEEPARPRAEPLAAEARLRGAISQAGVGEISPGQPVEFDGGSGILDRFDLTDDGELVARVRTPDGGETVVGVESGNLAPVQGGKSDESVTPPAPDVTPVPPQAESQKGQEGISAFNAAPLQGEIIPPRRTLSLDEARAKVVSPVRGEISPAPAALPGAAARRALPPPPEAPPIIPPAPSAERPPIPMPPPGLLVRTVSKPQEGEDFDLRIMRDGKQIGTVTGEIRNGEAVDVTTIRADGVPQLDPAEARRVKAMVEEVVGKIDPRKSVDARRDVAALWQEEEREAVAGEISPVAEPDASERWAKIANNPLIWRYRKRIYDGADRAKVDQDIRRYIASAKRSGRPLTENERHLEEWVKGGMEGAGPRELPAGTRGEGPGAPSESEAAAVAPGTAGPPSSRGSAPAETPAEKAPVSAGAPLKTTKRVEVRTIAGPLEGEIEGPAAEFGAVWVRTDSGERLRVHSDNLRPIPEQPASAPPLTLERYSDKASIIRGDTRAHKDRIKAAGVTARWNPRAQGWVFPTRLEAKAREKLGDLLGPDGGARPAVSPAAGGAVDLDAPERGAGAVPDRVGAPDAVAPAADADEAGRRGAAGGEVSDRPAGVSGPLTSAPAAAPPPEPEVSGRREEVSGESDPGPSPARTEALALRLVDRLDAMSASRQVKLTNRDLFDLADQAFGGTRGQGVYTGKDAYEALELALNIRARRTGPTVLHDETRLAETAVRMVEDVVDRLPTPTARTDEQVEFQQFSTPTHYSYAIGWIGHVQPGEVILEPSAGLGSLIAHPGFRVAGAKQVTIIANELSPRRRALLEQTGLADRVMGEDAEQIHNLYPKGEKRPTLILMNPPFSAAGSRGVKGVAGRMVGANHIEQALKVLAPGGRLVAIVGGGTDSEFRTSQGMARNSPTFKAWWDKIEAKYRVRANVRVAGSVYRKFGTDFATRVLVIDNDGPTTEKPVLAEVATITDLIRTLEGVRNDRPAVERGDQEQAAAAPGAAKRPVSAGAPGGGARSGARGAQPSARGTGEVRDGDRGPVADSGRSEAARPDRESAASGRDGREDADQAPDQGSQPDAGVAVDHRDGGQQLDTPAVGEGLALEEVEKKIRAKRPDLGESVFEQYEPQRARIPGAKPHPSPLVESAAMASVLPPPVTYQPRLPQRIIKDGLLSAAQLEQVIYAGQAFQEQLRDGSRKGYFIGDGTGVGKGREISGIIMDAMMSPEIQIGKGKAVWISKNQKLFHDAKRDWSGIGGDEGQLFNQKTTKASDRISRDKGIVFSTYDTLKTGLSVDKDGNFRESKSASRLKQLVDWLGRDFEGVIAFDESHMMANATDLKLDNGMKKEGSARAKAGLALQRMLPKARVLYVSATGATEVSNLAYAERLGLWGPGTAFPTASDFIGKIGAGGIAAMEIVARDAKQLGAYAARSLSMHGVTFDRLEHPLTPEQTDVYNRLVESWQIVIREMRESLEETGGVNDRWARMRVESALWGAHQRFFNQVITSMQTPTVFKDIDQELERGNSIVLQVVNTNAAQLGRAEAKRADEEDPDDDLAADLDLTPKEDFIGMVEKAYPTQAYEEQIDDEGKSTWVPVLDSQGNPVEDAEAVRKRDALLDELASLDVPEGPLDLVIRRYGVKKVAEVTGRNRRAVYEGGRQKVVSFTEAMARADAKDFQAGQKRILIFSDAGGTGQSYHADRGAKNRQKRVHYLLQPGWRADMAMQGFGRTHRTNQVEPPHYRLLSTNLPAQKRFISSIARRLGQLGAITRGQRQAGETVFSEKDNLESSYAQMAVRSLLADASQGRGLGSLPMRELERQLGFKENDLFAEGSGYLVEKKLPEVTKFLNRLLNLTPDNQEIVFNAFSQRMEAAIAHAEATGTLDTGLQNLKGLSIRRTERQPIHVHEGGSTTDYVKVEVDTPAKKIPLKRIVDSPGQFDGFALNTRSGVLWAMEKRATVTDEKTGGVVGIRRLTRVTGKSQVVTEDKLRNRDAWQLYRLGETAAHETWRKQFGEAPDVQTDEVHMLVGTMLPIWDRLPRHGKVYRVQTDDGDVFIGREIHEGDLDETLEKFGVGASAPNLTPAQAVDAVLRDDTVLTLANGWTLAKRRLGGEARIELSGPSLSHHRELDLHGVFRERHGGRMRYFVPTGDKADGVVESLTSGRPIVKAQKRARGASDDDALASIRRRPDAAQPGVPLTEMLAELVRRINPDPDLKLWFEGEMRATGASAARHGLDPTQHYEQLGSYSPTFHVIRLSLAATSEERILTAVHEAWHSIDRLFTPEERAVLLDAYPSKDGVAHAERTAVAFQEWFAGQVRAKPAVRRIFAKVRDFLRRLGNALRGRGFQTLEDIFERVGRGEVGARYPSAPAATTRLDPWTGEVTRQEDAELSSIRTPVDPVVQARRAAADRHLAIKPGIADRIRAGLDQAFDRWRETAVQKTLDRFHSLRVLEGRLNEAFGSGQRRRFDASESAFTQAHFSQNLATVMEVVLHYGHVKWDAAQQKPVVDEKVPGLLKILSGLKSPQELRDWEHYAWARRANELKKQGREPADQADIDAGLAWESDHPHFRDVFDQWGAFNRATLDFAVAAGVIKPELRDQLAADMNYVPFFRAEVDEKGRLVHKGPNTKSGLANQRSGIRKLVGSTAPVAIVENMVMNTTKLLDASYKNIAMQRAVKFMHQGNALGETVISRKPRDWKPNMVPRDMLVSQLERAGADPAAIEAATDQMPDIAKVFGMVPPAGPRVVSVMVGGKPQYHEIHDDLLLESVAALSPRQLGGLVRALSIPARMLRFGVTHDPSFAIRNFFRDTLSAWVTTGGTTKHFLEVARAFGEAIERDPETLDIMATGAGIGGWYQYAPDDVRKRLEKELSSSLGGSVLGVGAGAWRAYKRVLQASEQANRIAVHREMLNAGRSSAEAAFEAMDLLNFSARGSSEAVRILTQLTPFLNARFQGLHRLVRAASGDTPNIRGTRAGVLINGMIIMGLTSLLWWDNQDDEDYQDLPEWARDTYYHIRMPASVEAETGVRWLRLPKPFEVGVIFSTLPERVLSAAKSEDEDWKTVLQTMATALQETFAVGSPPIIGAPQVTAPWLALWLNEHPFFGSPIVPPFEKEMRRPVAQFGPGTSQIGKAVARAADSALAEVGVESPLSPRAFDHLWNSYTGTLGRYALAGADALYEGMTAGAPGVPKRLDQMPVIQSFISQGPARSTKWRDEFYDLRNEVEDIYGSITAFKKSQDIEAMRDLAQREGVKLSLRKSLGRIADQAAAIRNARRALELEESMSADEKRRREDALLAKENEVFKQVRPLLRHLHEQEQRQGEQIGAERRQDQGGGQKQNVQGSRPAGVDVQQQMATMIRDGNPSQAVIERATPEDVIAAAQLAGSPALAAILQSMPK